MLDRYKDTFHTAIDKWGEEMQLTVAIEEMSELTKEICKHYRGEQNLDAISEEMADVYIMLEQMMMIFMNKVEVYRWIDSKVDRLRRMISMKKECDTCKHEGNYLSEEPCNKCHANKYWEPRLKNEGIKLKPCPFCGGEVKLIDTGDYAGFCISCEECDSLFTIERIGATEDDLINVWERREKE